MGGSGNDLIVGGPGQDTLAGRQGSDRIYPDGDDTVVWNPGDGSDVVEGRGANNTLVFNGANVSEHFDLSANGSRLRLTRDVAAVTLDVNGVQTVDIITLGGADNVTVNSLSGTAVTQVNVDLAATGGAGDGQPDTVALNGTAGPDTFNLAANGSAIEAADLGTLVRVANAELANDRVVVNGVGGDTVNANGTAGLDTMQLLPSPVTGYARVNISSSAPPIDVIGALTLAVNGLGGTDTIVAGNGLAALGIPLVLDGGDDDDFIAGGDAAETIIGGPGNDTVSGGRGNDVILLGNGNDTCTWNPGDGSDTIEGQLGNDTLVFNGANVSEHFDLSANGSRLRLFRDVANVILDANGLETVNIQALGGADNVTVNSLAGTSVTQVNVDLAATGGTGDSQPDTVTINGTEASDKIDLTANAGTVVATGLAAQVQITHPEVALDTLIVNGLGGIDSFGLGPVVTTLIAVILNQ